MTRSALQQADAFDQTAWANWFRSWALEAALPVWSEHGCDHAAGGFFDRLDPQSLQNTANYKRLRVTARQIYVFATAARLGFGDGAALAQHGLEHLLGPCRIAAGGFRSRMTLANAPVDGPIDLYDNAFALFALAHGYGLKPDAALLDAARDQCEFLLRAFAHPAGGFMESLPPAQPRRQNPHMHLLEALLAWIDLLGPEEPFRAMADAIIELAEQRLFTPADSLLIEFFEDDWQPRAWQAEPGHHFEWVWLLSESRRLGLACPDLGTPLYRMALGHGRDPSSGFLYGAFGAGGAPLETAVRLWPHTEWLRAETLADSGNLGLAAAAVARFLDHPVPGLWYENLDPDRGFQLEDVPASSLYHIVGAILALLRSGPGGA